MSQPIQIESPSTNESASKSDSSAIDKLPISCRVPGYWENLAQNSTDWAHIVSAHSLWREAQGELEKWKKEYRRKNGGTLYKSSKFPDFVGKSHARIREKIIEKISRSEDSGKEVKRLFNQSVPVPQLEDLVRVRLETQFLDGVPFLASKVLALARKFDPESFIEAKGKLSGYFAQHISFKLPVHYRFAASTTSCLVTCEVQVATTLATLVWENSHGLYEGTRTNIERSEDWQWSPSDPRFLSRQLGHMIHLADGLFCNLRDQVKPRK
jgi:hypothetical protein